MKGNGYKTMLMCRAVVIIIIIIIIITFVKVITFIFGRGVAKKNRSFLFETSLRL